LSGIVGILQLDGAPVDGRLLRQMTEFMAYRGPDAQESWNAGPIGLGHALLRTAPESASERQPCTLDGDVWIVADARVDARAELLLQLGAICYRDLQRSSDAELILQAYQAWGEDCLEHLLGDFSFAIWDKRRRRLFCARDHLGVKPFYYALAGGSLVFSNTLDCVRLHPGVSDELNDRAIGDFLLFDFNEDPATTSFADIQRLPAAHTLGCSEGALRVRRYWTLPAAEEEVRYRSADDYLEQFRELLRLAVADRLRCDRIGVLMGGGLDSTSVAATAKQVLNNTSTPCELRAFTVIYRQLIPDDEGYYAGLVGDALGFPVQYLALDDHSLYDDRSEAEFHTPEPVHDPLPSVMAECLRQTSAHHRVVLTGFGGDPALSSSLSAHFLRLVKGLQFARLCGDLNCYLRAEGRLSRLYVRTRLGIFLARHRRESGYPAWLNHQFAARLDLPARFEQFKKDPAPESLVARQPVRPEAYQAVSAPAWACLFERLDPGARRMPVESRHPFLDLRLLRYLLALPALPWCADKELLRLAMRGVLPEPVRLRGKSPVADDWLAALLKRGPRPWQKPKVSAPLLARYVAWERVPELSGTEGSDELWRDLRPISLHYWLQHLRGSALHAGGREPAAVELTAARPA